MLRFRSAPRRKSKQSWFWAFVPPLCALLLRFILNEVSGYGAPYLVFFLAATASASRGGWWPGLPSLAFGALLSGFVVAPGGWAHLLDPNDPFGVVRYSVAGLFVCWICDALIEARERAEAAEREVRIQETRLREQAETLKRSNYDLEQFAFVASHDIQEPLRVVSLYSQLLLQKIDAASLEERALYSATIEDAVAKAQSLIRDLLQYSRVIHGESGVEPVDCNAVAAAALDAVRGSAEQDGAEFSIGPLPFVLAQPSLLLQVFQNLFSNAIRYRKDEMAPQIQVRATVDAGVAIISVRDNGIGFDEQSREKIFGLFTRLHRERDGTGLGLAICKRIIERFGGTIWARSVEGAGATFTFTLPLASDLGECRGPSLTPGQLDTDPP